MIRVVLTKDGDALTIYNHSRQEIKTTENSELIFGEITHDICGGVLVLSQISETKRAIACRLCNLRVVIPIDLNTFRALRAYFKKYNP